MECDDIRLKFIDYLDNNLTAEDEKKLVDHIEGCEECRKELESLKKLVNEINENAENISVPEDFMDNIGQRALKIGPPVIKKKKAPFKILLIAAAILIMSMATVFATKNPMAELIKLMNPEPRITNTVNNGVGKRLNISKTDKNIKITITDVVADDIQTLISYKIEDLNNGKEYNIRFDDGIIIKERWGNQIKDTNIEMYTSLFNNEGKGILTLFPIDTDNKTINLSFTKLEAKTGDTTEIIDGNWNFQIPIKKYQGKSYNINATIKADDYVINFTKITISPTLTKINFNCSNGGKKNERINDLEDIRIVADGKEYKPYNFGHESWIPYSTVGYGDKEMTFDSMYFDNPKNVEIKVNRISTQITEDKPKEFMVKLDETSPQEFEYLGTKLVINDLKVSDNITFNLKQPINSSKFETLNIVFWPFNGHSQEKHFTGAGNYNEAYYIDKDNNKYGYYDALLIWDKIRTKNPVLYIANTSYKLHPSDGLDIKHEKFIRMIIDGYNKTVFVNGSAKVKLR
ncbi:DUF5643 domain-containing protein [Clostridium sp. JN-9]|uniref:DUF5643 domain-containing protein n=1 Tax=Clostridium sp. JN-9 TaxID=2507159 RepID=UPI000FFE232C|nr:DUF5643 domain-containing protein [Clostridium sp. JN-9]QAT41702.1 DUF4179 domain-containing protein [Clostridium sp. JN-9]